VAHWHLALEGTALALGNNQRITAKLWPACAMIFGAMLFFFSLIGACVLGWLLISFFENRAKKRRREQFEATLSPEARTMAKFDEYRAKR
jgi:hypothetical protein